MAKAKAAEPKVQAGSAGDDLLDSLGDVVSKDTKKKDSDTPKIVVAEKAVVEALKKMSEAKKKRKEADQMVKAAESVIDPAARTAHQQRARLDKQTYKSVHLYDSATQNGVTYVLGRFQPGEEAAGLDKEGRSKVGPARAALKALFAEKFDEYIGVSVSLSIKEEACTAETVKLLKEKLGEDTFKALFQSDPCLVFHQVSATDKQQKLMRDYVMDDGIQQKVSEAMSKQLIKRGYDALK
jgi:hypothetical protein